MSYGCYLIPLTLQDIRRTMSNIIDLNKYKEDKIAENYKTKTTGDFYNKIIKASALKSLKNGMISQEVFDSKFKDL